jgi:CRISPR system Cascade subunit CasE
MFLSKVILNPRHRVTYRLMNDLYAQHRFVMSAFPDLRETEQNLEGTQDLQGVLYRLEAAPQSNLLYFLVQSRIEADWTRTGELHRDVLCASHSKEDRRTFQTGEHVRFRLRASPTVCRVNRDAEGNRRTPQRLGLYKEPEQRDWLARAAEQCGFGIVPEAILITPQGKREGYKPTPEGKAARAPLTCFMADFDGSLVITDAERFAVTVQKGVGRGKAWGCGLLSLMRT